MKNIVGLALLLFLTTGAALADTPKDPDPQAAKSAQAAKPKAAAKKVDKTAEIAAQLEELRKSLQAQQEQIQQLKNDLARRDQQITDARNAAAAADSKASEAAAKATEAAAASVEAKTAATAMSSDASDLKLSSESLKVAVQDTQKKIIAAESPSTLHYKGINITPGGFLDAATVYRTRATSSDINTPFTGIPYPGNALSKVTDNNFSGRHSRVSLLVEGKLANAKIGGYYEADFLGVGTTSNNRQSNSYVLRQRQAFALVTFDNGWSFSGGQMWSLAAENKKGIVNRTEIPPLTIDPQYSVGWTWARQYGFRVVKDFGGKFALGVSVEGPQATIGGRGFSLVTTTTVGSASVATTGNTFLNAPGAGGGLYNAFDATGYTSNKAPDVLVKAAFDPGWGHYEAFGIVSTFRNRVYPCGVVGTNGADTVVPATPTTVGCPNQASFTPSSAGAFNDSRTGGGFGVSANIPTFGKKLDFGIKGVAGDGIGRYGSAQLADLTFRPDGTQALIRTAHGLVRAELHVTPKVDIYAYYGSEYAWRAGYQGYNSISIVKTPAIPANGANPAIAPTTTTTFKLNQIGGYGNPFANNSGCATENPPSNQLTPSSGGTCAGDIRLITQGTLGFWHRVYQGPKGGVRWGIQYSYFSKNGWSGASNIAPKAVDNMILTSFRYYLP